MTEDELVAAVRARLSADAPPPATTQELAEAEHRLGFALHPLLQRLYLEMANGGWGPEYGSAGLIGGARPDLPADGLVSWYLTMRGPVPEDEPDWPGWPAALVPTAHWGCAIWSCVDCASIEGRVVRFDPNAIGAFDDDQWKAVWLPERSSIAGWLIDWLDGRLPFEMPASAVE
ncbi:MAG TPA: SMI1/KNR4 family protein [Acidimicrobiales bacterium]|nr:SMI1/KNR4 family protein [Acidimicrobiales bacterium]